MRLIDADALKEELRSWLTLPNRDNDAKDVVLHLISVIDNAPTVKPSLNLDNITDDDIEKFKMVWQRATSKGLLVINEEKPICCKDCKHQEKYWHEDKRMKEGGYWFHNLDTKVEEEKIDESWNLELKDLHLSTRAMMNLRRTGLYDVKQILMYDKPLIHIRNMGAATRNEVIDTIVGILLENELNYYYDEKLGHFVKGD